MIGKVGGSGYASALQRVGKSGKPKAASPVSEAKGADFSATLKSAVSSVDTSQRNADQALKELASGENVDLHGTMIALEKADIALRTMVSVRDKLVSAYEQVMNTAL